MNVEILINWGVILNMGCYSVHGNAILYIVTYDFNNGSSISIYSNNKIEIINHDGIS